MSINIAIDGYSSCGKSTLTRQLAQRLNYKFVDTGAMYRAVTYYLLLENIQLTSEAIVPILSSIQIEFDTEDQNLIYLNGENIGSQIRTMEVSSSVSQVAAISEVRAFLVKQQKEIAKHKRVVMDGRDIGTVVLKDAELKLFMTADKEVRIQRRYDELIQKGQTITKQEIKANLEHRDYVDTHRKDSPLSKAPDAILLDNTHMTIQEQLEFVLQIAQQRINNIKNNA